MSAHTVIRPLTVGDRTASEPCTVADVLTASGTVAPANSPVLGALAVASLVPSVPGGVPSGFDWNAHDPVSASDVVSADTVITRVSGRTARRYVRLVDQAGTVRESGTETWTFDDEQPTVPELDFCTPAWGALLAESLSEDRDFTSSLSTWDGTIGLRSGEIELHLRIYKGRIVDVTRRTPHGATFTFVASDHAWTDLVLSEENDFMRRAIRGEFSSTGDGYEYLRLTKPLNTIIGHARALARKARS
ncbi:hotdog fold domain-containing protein [Rhodococcus pyridinivorans]|uniref:hotdog fold domain-containing protein n=1 Tax=Rhodococcus pyridinivorans TaxID=103816 RepID=UPI00367F4E3A